MHGILTEMKGIDFLLWGGLVVEQEKKDIDAQNVYGS